ncbi:Creatinase/aminopeptidase [Trichodelitschia bisporula]|uniref:Xaa-Pro aminopeptidase n=1 Tax=Trichodelitschia bisporula TaxID=703511 RepID=A0A6G1HKH9_9PEZI|nr:Creatinase/aminopeptidase [Trichodelitschia bisporula]
MTAHMTLAQEKYHSKSHSLRVAAALGASAGAIVLRGTSTTLWSDCDQYVPFRQARYFYYLTGCDEPDCALLYDIESRRVILFIPPRDDHAAIWSGPTITPEQAYARYEIDNVLEMEDLDEVVAQWMDAHPRDTLFVHPCEQFTAERFACRVDSTSLLPAMDACRAIKTPQEIRLLQQANAVSAAAHTAVLRVISSLTNETEVEAAFLFACIATGAKHQAYGVIAASGANAATLHYGRNDEPLAGRQLLLLDAGAEYKLYASDVTRTFPISGHLSTEAGEIYGLVQAMQESCIARLRPGGAFVDLQVLAHAIAVEGLLKLGILRGERAAVLRAGVSLVFFPHGLGHHVGLDVHDVIAGVPLMGATSDSKRMEHARARDTGDVRDTTSSAMTDAGPHESVFSDSFLADDPDLVDHLRSMLVPPRASSLLKTRLAAGMVVTVEPGIYFSRVALRAAFADGRGRYIDGSVLGRYMGVGGVRIEDDIVITATGYDNITTAPKGEAALRIIREGGRCEEAV